MNKTTKWYTRPVYLLVALAVVVSLGVGGIVNQNPAQPPQVSAAVSGSPSLMVDIVKVLNATGGDNTTFNVSDDFLVNAAVAYKNINGTGNVSVSATITLPDNVELDGSEGGAYTKELGVIESNGTTDVWWRLHCTGNGTSIITVTASSASLADASANETVTQGEVAAETVLEITVTECPNQTELHQSDNFVIKANVTNTGNGDITARDVWGIISIPEAVNASLNASNPDRWFLDVIYPGETAEVMWNLHCDGPGEGNITINAEADNLGPTQIAEDTCYVYQETPPPEPEHGPFWVTVDAPAKHCQHNCGYENFTVNATVHNNYGANATNVTVTLVVTGEAIRRAGETATHNFSDCVANSTVLNGTVNTTSWNVSCRDPGIATFTVTTNATETWAKGKVGANSTNQKAFIVFITDVTNPNPGQNLTQPVTGNTTTLETCQNFTVNVTMRNCDCVGVDNVSATIDLPSSVRLQPSSNVTWAHYDKDGTLVAGPYNDPATTTLTGLTFCDCCYYNITWRLHCNQSSLGDAENITVIASHEGSELDSDYFKVIQGEKAHLTAGIEVYPGNYTNPNDPMVTTAVGAVTTAQNFTLVIPLFNLGEVSATNVSVNYTITGNSSCAGTHTSANISTLAGGTAGKNLTVCNCSGETDLNITINWINGTDLITGEEVPDENKFLPGNKTLMQIPFTVTIVQPAGYRDGNEGYTTFNCSDEFSVKVNLTNDSNEEDNNVTGVNATLDWTGNAEFVDADNQSRTIDLGGINYGSNSQEAAWLMHCNGTGYVTFTVTVTATEPIINIVRTVMIKQEGTTTLHVDILSPGSGAVYRTCEQFAVTAKVTNNGTKIANTVVATITPGAYCEVVGSSTIPIGTMEPLADQIVSWTLHAYKASSEACANGTSTINVNAAAPCAASDAKTVDVDVYPAAHLVVSITEAPTNNEVEVGSEFNITATVENTGWADASQVKLSIDTGANTALAAGESGTKFVGTLIGYGEGSSAEKTWTLQCEGAGKSTIIITPVGNDECGWHAKQDATTLETVWKQLPGRVIESAFLEAGGVTVEQKTIIPGDVVTTIDMVTYWNFISAPSKLENTTFTNFTSDINVSRAYEFDPTATPSFIKITDPINTTVNVLDGYWIDAYEPGTITLTYASGGMVLPPSKDLTGKKWNAIGFSSTSETGLSAVATLKSVEGSWTTLIGWNAADQKYEVAIIFEVNDGERMYPGKGYWLWVTADDTLAGVGA